MHTHPVDHPIARATAVQRRSELLTSHATSTVGRCQAARRMRDHQRLERARVRLAQSDALETLRTESASLRRHVRGGVLTADALRVLVQGRGVAREEPPSLPRHLRDVVDLVRSDLSADLSTGQLAAAAYLTPRALQLGFRRYFDLTPGEYVRRERLRTARARLLAADADTTVSAVAAGLGFVNAGRFAAGYRERYGESPSDTLRSVRRPDDAEPQS